MEGNKVVKGEIQGWDLEVPGLIFPVPPGSVARLFPRIVPRCDVRSLSLSLPNAGSAHTGLCRALGAASASARSISQPVEPASRRCSAAGRRFIAKVGSSELPPVAGTHGGRRSFMNGLARRLFVSTERSTSSTVRFCR
ncbi:hypothetical protein C8Q78DRAFT_1007298 [Trametes maxima]|nr:hypothetical protein C8Q78DRAFT_1007298 [Trametes maxima]